MVHTWPGQTKEEFLEEVRRDRALTPEQQKEEWDESLKQIDDIYNKWKQDKSTFSKPKADSDKWLYVNAEKPNSLDDGEALVTYLIIMGVGAIFNDRWFIWIFATIVYLCYLFRHAIRDWKWENGGKEKYYQEIKDVCKGDKK